MPGTGIMLANKSMSAFTRYIGIDYSGAKTPTASLTMGWELSCETG